MGKSYFTQHPFASGLLCGITASCLLVSIGLDAFDSAAVGWATTVSVVATMILTQDDPHRPAWVRRVGNWSLQQAHRWQHWYAAHIGQISPASTTTSGQ